MAYTTPEKRARICTLIKEGYSMRLVAKREDVHYSTVSRIYKSYLKTGSYQNKPKTGRSKTFSSRGERQIVRMITSNNYQTAVDAQSSLKTNNNMDVSANTVRRILTRSGLKAHIKRKKPLLQKKHRQARLSFAKKYQHWTEQDWSKIIWSDESKFMIFGSDGKQYCWRRPSESLQDKNVTPTVKYGGGSIMVWGCMTFHGIGYLCRIDNGLDSELYCQILGDELEETILWYNLNKEDITVASKCIATPQNVQYFYNLSQTTMG